MSTGDPLTHSGPSTPPMKVSVRTHINDFTRLRKFLCDPLYIGDSYSSSFEHHDFKEGLRTHISLHKDVKSDGKSPKLDTLLFQK